ncbi:exonuclease 1 [Podarcis lilfordi]|uniref:Exonuclease 1 n=1 Tax=Podarcis lilfordi TaxID=74358 RepID=A0AA35KZJ5_9SAUR|nr:exonuclease 1 [Podarcis lilfordi]
MELIWSSGAVNGRFLLRAEGKLSEARECFACSIDVTHAMACEVIKAARARGIDCIVAPYEADAQLAYLNKTGLVEARITEDSDRLAFECKKRTEFSVQSFYSLCKPNQAAAGKEVQKNSKRPQTNPR